LFGIAGWFLLYKKDQKNAALFLGVIGADVLLYSMWFDPWGGWAFGSRYLVPAYALFAITTAILLTKYKRNIYILLLFFVVLSYSVLVNSLGAITTNRVPPQVEVLNLEELSGVVQKYTYERNWDMLNSNSSKAYVWQAYAKDSMSAVEYYYLINVLLFALGIGLFVNLRFGKSIKL
jgi:hypothetical protein